MANNKFYLLASLFLGVLSSTMAFLPAFSPNTQKTTPQTTSALASSPNEDQLRKLLQDEAMNADNLKASAKEMQNMTPEQLDQMIQEMEKMPSWQKEALKKMGMDPDLMKQSMEQFKQNPNLLKDMGKMMDDMTPEQLMEQSRMAQEQMRQAKGSGTTSTSTTAAAATASTNKPVTDVEVVKEDSKDKENKDDEEEEEDEDDEPIEPNSEVLDAMYEVAKIMGNGKVTLSAFRTVPVIALLSGTGEDDLDEKELKDCWNKGSLGATTVERAGFERVWREVQDNYYSDIVEEAHLRMPNLRKKKRGSTAKPTSTAPPMTPNTAAAAAATMPQVGANLTPEQLKQQVENISDDDITKMFESMANMSPADEARMKAMGVDPAMMKKQAEMMKSNPMMRMAAKQMIKNTSPEQLMKASQDAQQKFANMTEEEKKAFMEGNNM